MIGIDRGHPGAVERSAGIVPRTVEAHVVHRREEFGSRQQHAGLTLGHRLLVVCRTVDVEPQVGAFADDLLHLRLGRIDQREVLLGRRALQTRQLHLGQLRDAVPLVDHRCEVHRLGGVTTHQHGVVRRDVAAAEVVAPETAARMQAFEGRNGILLEEFPHERRPAVVARRVGQHARSVRAVPVVKPLAHTRYEEVANPALGQDLGHLHRAARDIDVVGRPVVAAGQVLADPLAAVIGLAHQLFARSEPLVGLVVGGAPHEAALLVTLDHLVATLGMRLKELHEVERLLHFESEVRILAHDVQRRNDDILDAFGAAVFGRVHPGYVLMRRLDNVDRTVAEIAPVIGDRSLDGFG